MILSRKITKTGYEVEFSGVVTSHEMFEIGEEFKNHPDFENILYIFMHFTEIENMLINTAELKQLAELDREASKRNPNIRFAIATDSPLVYGLARMWDAFYDPGPWQPKLFKDVSDARKWVNTVNLK